MNKITPKKVEYMQKAPWNPSTDGPVEYVAYVESCFDNCPTCSGFSYYKMSKFSSFEDVMSFALYHMNDLHIEDVISINSDDRWSFKYSGAKNHSYHCIEVLDYLSEKILYRTVDNGSGKLVWEENS